MKIHRSLIIASFACMSLSQPCRAASTVDAVWAVESGGALHAKRGDHGLARGPLQIHFEAWKDSRLAGQWSDCEDIEYSKRVFAAVCKRYKVTEPDEQAALWNLGNTGRNDPAKAGQRAAYLKRFHAAGGGA